MRFQRFETYRLAMLDNLSSDAIQALLAKAETFQTTVEGLFANGSIPSGAYLADGTSHFVAEDDAGENLLENWAPLDDPIATQIIWGEIGDIEENVLYHGLILSYQEGLTSDSTVEDANGSQIDIWDAVDNVIIAHTEDHGRSAVNSNSSSTMMMEFFKTTEVRDKVLEALKTLPFIASIGKLTMLLTVEELSPPEAEAA